MFGAATERVHREKGVEQTELNATKETHTEIHGHEGSIKILIA